MNIEALLSTWAEPDRKNLAELIGCSDPSPKQLGDRFQQLYNSNLRAGGKATVINSSKFVSKLVSKKDQPYVSVRDQWRDATYEALLEGALRITRSEDKSATVAEREQFLVQALFVRLLANLKPRERAQFFDTPVDLHEVAAEAGIGKANLKGQVSALAALSAAQASGFGIYLFATTVLGALTHLVGVTLPFAVYMGLTSFISFVIGPAGWGLVSFSILKKLTDPNWRKILPGLVYIISVRHRPEGAR